VTPNAKSRARISIGDENGCSLCQLAAVLRRQLPLGLHARAPFVCRPKWSWPPAHWARLLCNWCRRRGRQAERAHVRALACTSVAPGRMGGRPGGRAVKNRRRRRPAEAYVTSAQLSPAARRERCPGPLWPPPPPPQPARQREGLRRKASRSFPCQPKPSAKIPRVWPPPPPPPNWAAPGKARVQVCAAQQRGRSRAEFIALV